jgi:hypothetical protein
MTRSKKLDELVGSVEKLMVRLPENLTPELDELRDKVDAGIFEAWTAVAREAADTRHRATRPLGARLGSTVGIALLAGASSLVAYRIMHSAK